ncbi:Mitochondrial import inner membrane translocase subunit tim8 [Didymosphaeria variabile]|uniref:Mitochondrial import inner membrane translocase subunit tim8 n=1 Tax=Didymosphaeria variabile TaxID=1932322 RepID=A0A9W8XP45_9PLEO|nr:Mitochondrial import inner membrane translocase subunit tim8 [Didymosphaeria variabile]KAJ4355814.1 Mitochondrial import inner membrane translocase subunit tim8 [Didymosphaeria variabile]
MRINVISVLFAFVGLAMGRATGWAEAPVPRDFNPDKLADDKTWDKFKCKGEQLVAAMKGSEEEAAKLMNLPHAQSEWTELKTWAYTEAYASSINCDLKSYWAVESACKALGLDTRPKMMGGANICYNFQHWDPNKKDDKGNIVPKAKQTYQVDGKEYRATGAEMQIGINPVGGVVLMQYVTSPATAALNVWNKKATLDELPALRHLSDVMWGAWNRENADISKIKYFWVQGVGNTNSKAVIARALKAAGKELEKWPGTTLDMTDNGALAILGEIFRPGNKLIEKVQIFKNDRDKNPDPDLIFYVSDSPAQ